ncbi:DUF418 domain-containing protein [Phycicoccus flavus]|uniref:DUF418 domain-containing protein n=1 Tax=Phycicoccus flavus TaxID=2502783 RepID=A0A8T6QXT6_9MICO|nr:DUF418 domain-containing protein [Phycicoccus flavus]NHA66669.1 DUF418 domain-containing protein [Phycicoccus flavus]
MASEVGHSATGTPGADPASPGNGGRHRSTPHHGRAPGAARPGATGDRLAGLDAARGLAVLSMLVAHLSPVGGVLDLSEYLTAPLFAVTIGAAMGLALARPHVDRLRFVLDNALRGVLLVLLGVVLQALYWQIDVVLPYLGVLVVVLAPFALLLRPVPVLAVGLVVAGAVLGPVVTERAREAVAAGTAATGLTRDLVLWTATGPSYRLVSFLPMALAGVLLAALLPRLTRPGLPAALAAVLVTTSGVVHVLGLRTADGAAPYSGSTAEVVAATFLAAGAVAASFALVALARAAVPVVSPVLGRLLLPVLAVGRLALTAYTLQVLVLAVIAGVRDGARDDTWPVLLTTTAVVVGACWALDRFAGTGPLEVLVRAARVPERGRHGGPRRSQPAASGDVGPT